MPKCDGLESKALNLIISRGKQGILQSELWRVLGGSSREGSRISIKLGKKGLIRRERELNNSRWTYRLYAKILPPSIDSIIDLPCLTCPDESKCGPQLITTPNNCEKITSWILNSEKNSR